MQPVRNTTVYGFTCFDLPEGPMVMEVTTGVPGPVDDADFCWVNDIGLTGPDAGKSGAHLSCRRARMVTASGTAVPFA
jgi:hypothetical protein